MVERVPTGDSPPPLPSSPPPPDDDPPPTPLTSLPYRYLDHSGEPTSQPQSPTNGDSSRGGSRTERLRKQIRDVLRAFFRRRGEEEEARMNADNKISKSWHAGLGTQPNKFIGRDLSNYSIPVKPEAAGDWAFIDD